MSRTGQFLQALAAGARASGDPNEDAFTLGSVVGFSADICGNGFVNSIVEAPYRNQWWRHRWISNYIDTWAWGFYGLGGGAAVSLNSVGDAVPPYTTWPNLCEARLHRRVEMGGITADTVLNAIRGRATVPDFLPTTFVDFWLAAYQGAYGTDPRLVGIDEPAVQSAYAMLYLILWLQTSGEFLPCVPPDQINYPDGCGARPPWVAVDGSVVVGGTTLATPPSPGTPMSPNVAEIVSGILLAILGVVALFAGGVLGGILTIGAGVALIVDGATEPDWPALNCYYRWVLVYLENFYNTLHDLLKWAGFGFPYTAELAHNPILFSLSQVVSPPDAALNTARAGRRRPTRVVDGTHSQATGLSRRPNRSSHRGRLRTWRDNSFHGISLTDCPQSDLGSHLRRKRNPIGIGPNGLPIVRDPAVWDDRRNQLTTPSPGARWRAVRQHRRRRRRSH